MCSRDERPLFMDCPRRDAQQGTGLVDTLVALLLLALSLLGACTMIVRTMGASHAAALQTMAADLATDLAEDLRAGAIDPLDVQAIQEWRSRVAETLPVGTPPLDAFAGVAPEPQQAGKPRALNVSLRWWDPAIHLPATLSMQVAAAQALPEP